MRWSVVHFPRRFTQWILKHESSASCTPSLIQSLRGLKFWVVLFIAVLELQEALWCWLLQDLVTLVCHPNKPQPALWSSRNVGSGKSLPPSRWSSASNEALGRTATDDLPLAAARTPSSGNQVNITTCNNFPRKWVQNPEHSSEHPA